MLQGQKIQIWMLERLVEEEVILLLTQGLFNKTTRSGLGTKSEVIN